MSHTTIDEQLERLESQLNALSGSLIESDPILLQDVSATFQHLTVDLLQMANDLQRSVVPSLFLERIVELSSGLATFRENLLRRRAYIDCALGVLIPTTGEKSTYAGSRVYGSSASRSGIFAGYSA